MQPNALMALGMAVVLNEVFYDPPGTDGGNEFVELLNVGDVDVQLDALQLDVGDGARAVWSVAWQGSTGVLPPGGRLVIGGNSVPERAADLRIALQNGPDAVRLLANGTVIDLLGYGDLADAALYEGRPAPDVSGTSLARLPDGSDTQDNHADFAPRAPTPGRRNVAVRNWCVRLVEPAPERLWPLRRHVFTARLHNCGLAPVQAHDCSLHAGLAPMVGEPAVDGVVRGSARSLEIDVERRELIPGDSLDALIHWTGAPGLFELDVRSGADEDTLDNRARMFVRVGAGPVLIHEILYAPDAGGPEWIELWNRDARAHDIAGWTLADASGRKGRIRGGTRLEPGGFALVLEDTSGPRLAPVPHGLAVPWPSLNNTDGDAGFADVLVLRDTLGIVQDALFYSTRNGVQGRSLERVTADPDVRGLVWSVCKHPDGATPGATNSSGVADVPDAGVVLQPNPFSPDGDGHEDVLVVQVLVPDGHAGLRAAVYDLEGRRRAELGGDRLGPGPRRFAWDGTGSDGIPVDTGVYLLYFEFIGNPGYHAKRVVGVVRP